MKKKAGSEDFYSGGAPKGDEATMNTLLQKQREPSTTFYYERSRLNALFKEAAEYPLVLVCAGAGYGKTCAVHDFTMNFPGATAWLQLSELDNMGTRFWKKFTNAFEEINQPFMQIASELGFPDTDDKLSHHFGYINEHINNHRRILVMDDFHLIDDPDVLHFVEHGVPMMPEGTSLFILSRSIPAINLASLNSKGIVYTISENDLRFTDNELTQYFFQQELKLPLDQQREIIEDTKGWAFAINLIARSYKRAPGYKGYLRNAMKTNIFQVMEAEIFDKCSDDLKVFLVRLSLIEHLSTDLISLLANGDLDLIAELEKQNAYVRRDIHINTYLVHHLFKEFLCQKQSLLTEAQKQETFAIAADWCDRNGFMIDALRYFEKLGDYASIVAAFFELPTQVPLDIARYALGIFDRAPAEVFDQVDIFAVMHVRVLMSLGLWQEAQETMDKYEEKYLKLPEDSAFRAHTLGGIYYCKGILRTLNATTDHVYDFDQYYAKQDECLSKFPVDPGPLANHPVGAWVSLVGSSEAGAPQAYIETLTRSVVHTIHCFNGAMAGLDDLARAELKYYQGDIRAAELHIIQSLERAREHKQYEIIRQALFYTLRCAFAQGDLSKADKALEEMKELLDIKDYPNRFFCYDTTLAWYYCLLGLPEQIPSWLKDKFTPYGHAYFLENFGNRIKARYFYLTKNYAPLLAYMAEQRQRETILYGRLLMMALEACVHYKMKDKDKAFAALKEGYEEAAPNDLIMPFIELGKDMRTLSAAALKDPDCDIPDSWLESVNRQSATYAKRQAHLVACYNKIHHIRQDVVFSPRELEILADLSQGLSRKSIADSRGLSVNTVKMVINNIYSKLGVKNLADLIRVAVEQELV